MMLWVLVAICAIGLGLVLAAYPQWVLGAVVVSTFSISPVTYVTLFKLGRMNVYRDDVLVVAMGLILLIFLVRGRLSLPRLGITAPLLLLALDFMLVTFMAPAESRETRHLLRDAGNLAAHIAIFCAYCAVRNEQGVLRWAKIVWGVGVLGSAFAITMRILGIESPAFFEGQADVGVAFGHYSRAYGIPGSIFFSLYGMIIGLALLIQRPRFLQPKVYAALVVGTAVCGLQLGLFMARTYWLAGMAGLLMIGLTLPVRNKVRILVGLVCAGVVGLVVLSLVSENLPRQIGERFLSMFFVQESGEGARMTREGRATEFRQVVAELQHGGFWFGRGLGAQYTVLLPDETQTVAYHNGFATVLLKVGVLGLGLWVWFVARIALAVASVGRQSAPPRIKGLVLGFGSAYIAAAATALGAFGPPMMPTLLDGLLLGVGLRGLSILEHQVRAGRVAVLERPGRPVPGELVGA